MSTMDISVDNSSNLGAYTVVMVSDMYVLISDSKQPGSPTLTNSAQRVIADLENRIGKLGGRRLFYRDSVNRYDEILHKDGIVCGFAPGTAAQQDFFTRIHASRSV